MPTQSCAGLDYLAAATALLRRVRSAHATAGLLEAADLHWWWRSPRSTDSCPQLFWFDDRGPQAAVIATDWGDGIALDPIVMAGSSPQWVEHVVERGLAHAAALGFESVDVVADSSDPVMCRALLDHGLQRAECGAPASMAGTSVVCAWLDADARPVTSPLCEGYRLCSRLDTRHRPHHMVRRSGPAVESRLRQTSLYRAEFDLVALDAHDEVAAYALFWFDPVTATGLVEPMRTEDSHQRRGLARHLLTHGLGLLAAAGAKRIKICFKPDNAAARDLYLRVGFVPDKQTMTFCRRARAGAA
jgi:GNAT superfamily N-acetyltransferase